MVTFLTYKTFDYKNKCESIYQYSKSKYRASERHAPLIWLGTVNKINKHMLFLL